MDEYRENLEKKQEEKKEEVKQVEVGGSFYEGRRQDLKENYEVLKELFDESGEMKELELNSEERDERDKLMLESDKADFNEDELKIDSEILERVNLKEEKIEELLGIAEKKGVLHSIKVAKNTRDELLIDTWHDILVKGRLFEKFKK